MINRDARSSILTLVSLPRLALHGTTTYVQISRQFFGRSCERRITPIIPSMLKIGAMRALPHTPRIATVPVTNRIGEELCFWIMEFLRPPP
jgi:hypothetical protein